MNKSFLMTKSKRDLLVEPHTDITLISLLHKQSMEQWMRARVLQDNIDRHDRNELRVHCRCPTPPRHSPFHSPMRMMPIGWWARRSPIIMPMSKLNRTDWSFWQSTILQGLIVLPMWPGNWWTFSTTIVSPRAQLLPQTPLPYWIRVQANGP